MTKRTYHTLLPAGLEDLLPPEAEQEAEVTHRVLEHFSTRGYQWVKPPLMEFTETLLSAATAEEVQQTFRVMDPLSQRMMAVRSDITPQVGRIARTRLIDVPRPLRLSYCGEVLRVKGGQLRPDRQFCQVGIELIGHDSAYADAEVIMIMAESVMELGLAGVSVDLSLPTLVPSILKSLDLESNDSLRAGLDHKDTAAVIAMAGEGAEILSALLSAVGPADIGLEIIQRLDLPSEASHSCERLAKVMELVRDALPDLVLTLDPVENRDFEYHTGIAFTLFSRVVSGELGRGGRYLALGEEPSVGATFFMDSILQSLPKKQRNKRVYVPFGCGQARVQRLRTQGWTTIMALEAHDYPQSEASRLSCNHILTLDGVEPLDSN